MDFDKCLQIKYAHDVMTHIKKLNTLTLLQRLAPLPAFAPLILIAYPQE